MQNPPKVQKVLFKKEDIIDISQDLQLSNKETKILSRDIRAVTGNRNAIEPYTREAIIEANHQLDDFFELGKLLYIREDKQKKISEKLVSRPLFARI